MTSILSPRKRIQMEFQLITILFLALSLVDALRAFTPELKNCDLQKQFFNKTFTPLKEASRLFLHFFHEL